MEHAELCSTIARAESRGYARTARRFTGELGRQPGMTGKYARVLIDRAHQLRGTKPLGRPSQ